MPMCMSASRVCETHHAVDRVTYHEVEISGEATFQSIKISYEKELADMDTPFFFFFGKLERICFYHYDREIEHENNYSQFKTDCKSTLKQNHFWCLSSVWVNVAYEKA